MRPCVVQCRNAAGLRVSPCAPSATQAAGAIQKRVGGPAKPKSSMHSGAPQRQSSSMTATMKLPGGQRLHRCHPGRERSSSHLQGLLRRRRPLEARAIDARAAFPPLTELEVGCGTGARSRTALHTSRWRESWARREVRTTTTTTRRADTVLTCIPLTLLTSSRARQERARLPPPTSPPACSSRPCVCVVSALACVRVSHGGRARLRRESDRNRTDERENPVSV
mmetsp:Transcript_2897/g.8440  ORF Transcript_2897/g.8440 Transcript_2897/m.8440 type:complete len:224 (-) Transcript_2897:60-731(-)